METVGIKVLKNKLSYYLKKVRQGEVVIITDRKREVAQIIPMERNRDQERVLTLVRYGYASWQGGKPKGSQRPHKVKGKALAEIVLEDRG